jgi:hypothetical protein
MFPIEFYASCYYSQLRPPTGKAAAVNEKTAVYVGRSLPVLRMNAMPSSSRSKTRPKKKETKPGIIKMEIEIFSKFSVKLYQATPRHIPDDE